MIPSHCILIQLILVQKLSHERKNIPLHLDEEQRRKGGDDEGDRFDKNDVAREPQNHRLDDKVEEGAVQDEKQR